MTIYDELQEASVLLGVPGLAGTGLTQGQLSDILNRIAELEAIALPPSQAILSGRWYGPLTALSGWPALTSRALTANVLRAGPLYIPQDAAFDTVGVEVSVAAAGATIRFGLYAAGTNGLPTNLIAEFGVVDASATGFRSIPITRTIPRGFYRLAGAPNTELSVMGTVNQAGVTAVLGHSGTNGENGRSAITRTTALASGFTDLPTTFGSVTTTFVIPAYWIRAA